MHSETPPPPPLAMRLGLDLPAEELQALGLAGLVIIAVAAVVLIRSRFATVSVNRDRLMRRPGEKRTLSAGRCRWRARPSHDDGAFRAWSCQRCGAMRWTASRNDPPGPCE